MNIPALVALLHENAWFQAHSIYAVSMSKAETSTVHPATFASASVPHIALTSGVAYSSILRLISKLHNSLRKALCRDEPQPGILAFPEELLPPPHKQRMNREIEHVEQVMLQ